MNPNSPTPQATFHQLRVHVFLHLEAAETLAARHGSWTEQDVKAAGSLIPDLVTVIRGMIVMHGEPDTVDGLRCASCGQDWPCLTLEFIHRLVKDPDREFVKLVELVEEA